MQGHRMMQAAEQTERAEDIAAYIEDADNYELVIVSGEDALGTEELYDGTRTVRAVKARLTRERAGGDRWAYVFPVYREEV